MTKDKWLDLKDKVKEKFEVEKEERGSLMDVPDSMTEILIFESPLGKIKLEWISKPKTLGEKTTYSRRIGSHVKVDKIYSADERAEYIKAHRQIDGEWCEINSNSFDNL